MDSIDNSVQKVIVALERIPHNYADYMKRIPYYHMGATLTDAVLQAGVNYKSVVYPRIQDILRKYPECRTTCDFIILFQTIPVGEIIQWNNKRKQDTLCELAWVLYESGLNTEDDVARWIVSKKNAEKVLQINGVGRKTIDYLKLLCGQQAIPIDRHMFQFLEIAGVLAGDYQEASVIMQKVASAIEVDESTLDRMIWNYMSSNESSRQLSFWDIYGDAGLQSFSASKV
jgi:hypothetical protein